MSSASIRAMPRSMRDLPADKLFIDMLPAAFYVGGLGVKSDRGAKMRALEGVAPGWGIAVVRVMMSIVLIGSGYEKFAGGIGRFSSFFPQLGLPMLFGWFIP